MHETLRFSASAAPIPLHTSQSPSFPRSNHLPVPSSKSSAVSLPPVPKSASLVKGAENGIPSMASSPRPLRELLLYLDSLGLDFLCCLNSHPPLISAPLSQVKSTVDFLFSMGFNSSDLCRIFRMCPNLLTSPTSTTIVPATNFLLHEALVDSGNLRHVIHRCPRLLTRSVDLHLRPTLCFLQGTIGIDNIATFSPLLSCSVESKLIPRIEYLQELGFSYKDAITMFRRFPSLFSYSIQENLKPKFDYFVVEMGRELKEVVAFPQFFSFSLEKRIKPRHKMCVEKQMCLSLPALLKSSEARFRHILELHCSSSLPIRTSPLWGTTNSTSYVTADQCKLGKSVDI